MDNKNINESKNSTRKPYKKPEVKNLGKLNALIRGAYSCGRADLGQEGSRINCSTL